MSNHIEREPIEFYIEFLRQLKYDCASNGGYLRSGWHWLEFMTDIETEIITLKTILK